MSFTGDWLIVKKLIFHVTIFDRVMVLFFFKPMTMQSWGVIVFCNNSEFYKFATTSELHISMNLFFLTSILSKGFVNAGTRFAT